MENHQNERMNTNTTRQEHISTNDLLLSTRAYNRKEISFDEWLKRSKKWAEHILRQYGQAGSSLED